MSTRRPKSVLDQERYTAELSTGQLVIGVCILLMFGLGCFLLGVLIGKFDPTLKPGTTGSVAVSSGGAAQPEVTVAEITVTSATPSPAASSTESSTQPELRVPPRILNESPAPAPVAESLPAAAASTSPPVASPAGDASIAESVGAAAEKNRVAPPGMSPQAVDESASEPPPAETPPAAAPAEAPAADAAWKGFGVQIIAVAKERAEAARKTLESKSSYKARVFPHTRNSLYRVVVGPFSDQPAALRARDDLRSRFGFKDAFVLTLQ